MIPVGGICTPPESPRGRAPFAEVAKLICYTEPNFLRDRRGLACVVTEKHCRTMPIVVAVLHGTKRRTGPTGGTTARRSTKYWQEHFERVRTLVGVGHGRPAGAQDDVVCRQASTAGTHRAVLRDGCDQLLDMLFKGNRSGKIGPLFSNNEDWSVPSAAIDRAWSNLRTMCRTEPRGTGVLSSHGRRVCSPRCWPTVRAGLPHHHRERRSGRVADHRIQRATVHSLTPCQRRDAAGKWAIVPENEANLAVERIISCHGQRMPHVRPAPAGHPDARRPSGPRPPTADPDFIDQTRARRKYVREGA